MHIFVWNSISKHDKISKLLMLSSACEHVLSNKKPLMGIFNMPIDLVLIRHGSSEGNLAFTLSRKGNHSLFTNKFFETHESKWRLTKEGREQASETGKWVKKNISYFFGKYLASEYVRALETAALLDLPHSHWNRNVFLRERNYGRLASLSYEERETRFSKAMEMRKRDAFYWTPPSGESLASVALRVDYILDQLSEEPLRPSSAIIITHFNVMHVFRSRIEMIRQKDFDYSKIINCTEDQKIKNAGVVHYTRRDPVTKEIYPVYKWKRHATPYLGGKFANPPWEEINYTTLTNEQILKEIEEVRKI